MTQKTELPHLSSEQLKVLERYAQLEATLDEVRCSLAGLMEFNFEPETRRLNAFFRVPEPGISISREHIENALSKKRIGKLGEKDLVNWASMLLMNDAYEFDPADEDFIADWLNDISYNLDPTSED